MNVSRSQIAASVLVAAGLLVSAAPSQAYRMIQNTTIGRVTDGSRVACNAAGGFTHWNTRNIIWSHNTAGQGAGKGTALTNAMASWTNVSGANHVLDYIGTTTSGWATDNSNTILWGVGNGCNTGCLALTALVLESGQVIIESDITFNANYAWNTNGTNYDVQTVATHELGHALGIHHTELTSTPRPTMYAEYFGTGGQTLETDDRSALQCAESTYAPSCTPHLGVCTRNSECCSGRCWYKSLPQKCF
jgi:hypothetical protein